MWNDIAFAILTGLFAALADIAISIGIQNPPVQLIFMTLAVSGLAYGVVDVMEDVVPARILGTSSAISASQAAGARALTRLKMLTLTISLSGLVLFIALGVVRSVYRRFAQ